VDLGKFDCSDGSFGSQTVNGQIPSDTQVHENPAVDGFNATAGAAPDWYQIEATGGAFCQDDVNLDLHLVSAKEMKGCYRLMLITDKNPQQACTTDENGNCHVGYGAGSYSDGSTIFFYVEKLCNAGVSDDASYQVTGHL